jgi:hypothetical protein
LAIRLYNNEGREIPKYKVTYPNDNNSPEIEIMKDFSIYEKPRDNDETGLSAMIEKTGTNLHD